MSHRAAQYEKSKHDANGLEALSAKLQADLRLNVRYMSDYPVLSAEWMEMAQQAERIGEITEMERNLPKSKDATLWECEEVALRYILEDGKLNLNLVAYNAYLQTYNAKDENVEDATQKAMEQFERGMGTTLKNAWLHAEAVHTTDIPLLIEYAHSVLRYHVANPKTRSSKSIESSQQVSTIYYLVGLARQLESMEESRIMPLILEKGVFSLLARHLCTKYELFTKETILTSLDAMALFCQTEHFQSHMEAYVSPEKTVEALISIQDNILQDLIKEMDNRRRFRPLLDVIKFACEK